MKIITCDLCKNKMGGNLTMTTCYMGEPSYSEFYQNPKTDMDICSECIEKLNKAVHNTIDTIKKKGGH